MPGRDCGLDPSDEAISIAHVTAVLGVKWKQARKITVRAGFPAPRGARGRWRLWSRAAVEEWGERWREARTLRQLAAGFGTTVSAIRQAWLVDPAFPASVGRRGRAKIYDAAAVRAWLDLRPKALAAADPRLVSLAEIAKRLGKTHTLAFHWLLYRGIKRAGPVRGFYDRAEVERALPRRESESEPEPIAQPEPEPDWLSSPAAAERLGLTWIAFESAVAAGELPKPDQIGGLGWGQRERLWRPATLAPYVDGGRR